MHVKVKSGRSQQRKKPSKPAKKADPDYQPKAQTKKPVVAVAEEKEKKKTTQGKSGKGKEAAAKKSDKGDDSWEIDEDDGAPSVMSLAERLAAQRQKVPSSSSSSAGSGTESVNGSSKSKAKKQTTLEKFGAKKVAEKKSKKADSDDDFIMDFSDEEVEEVPAVKRTARAATAKKVGTTTPSRGQRCLRTFFSG